MQPKPQFLRSAPVDRFLQLGLLAFTIAVAGGWQPAQAQLEIELNLATDIDLGTPGNRQGATHRSDTCVDTTASAGMMAVVPTNNTGLTLAASPDLFVYLPPNAAETVELRIFDDTTGEEVYAGEFAQPDNAKSPTHPQGDAIVKLPLADADVTLEPESAYLWAVLLVCDTTNRASDIVVDSGVRRVGDDYISTLPADVSDKLDSISTAATNEKLQTYGSAGLWQDLVTDLSDLVESQPTSYEATWSGLLSSQGMEAIADAPIYTTTLSPID